MTAIGVGAGPAGPVLAGPLFGDLMIFIIGVRERADLVAVYLNGVGARALTFYAAYSRRPPPPVPVCGSSASARITNGISLKQ